MVNLRNSRGAITLYIIIGLLFFLIAIVNVQVNLKNKQDSVEAEYQKIKTNYQKDANEIYANMNSSKLTIESLKASGKIVTESKVILLDNNDEQIVIPVGFKIKEDSPIEVKEGIVVVAPDESEFVWVPVEDISKMYGIRQVTVGETIKNVNTGKIYEFTKDGYNAINWLEQDGIMTWEKDWKRREPDILTGNDENGGGEGTDTGLNFLKNIIGIEGIIGQDDEEMLNTWKEQIQSEFDLMIESAKENKGFYVGRYETSIKENIDENGNTIKIAQSKRNEKSADASEDSANTWYGLYQIQRIYSNQNGLKNIIGSSMIWGSQYDQMMIWMQSNGIDVTSTTIIDEGKNNLNNITGSVETDKLNNVYDLLGCKYEWTLEASYADCRTYRGNAIDDKVPPSNRHTSVTNATYNDYGTRMAIYVK